jgi:hypothetical protein
MKSTKIACYALTVSAMVLAGLVFYHGHELVEPTANAQNVPDMTVTKGGFTVLSTEGCGGRSTVYVMDNRTEQLIAYSHARDIELVGQMDVAEQVDLALRAAGGGGGGGR